MQRLLRANNDFYVPDKSHSLTEDAEVLAMLSTQLAAKFLFTTGELPHVPVGQQNELCLLLNVYS